MDTALPVSKGSDEPDQSRVYFGPGGLAVENRMEDSAFIRMENTVFIRLLIALALLLTGSYLIAIAVTGITLLPLTIVAFAVSGSQTLPCGGITPFCNAATLQQLVGTFISELMLGLVFVIGSVFAAFFKFGTTRAATSTQPTV